MSTPQTVCKVLHLTTVVEYNFDITGGLNRQVNIGPWDWKSGLNAHYIFGLNSEVTLA